VRQVLGDKYDAAKFLKALEAVVPTDINTRRYNRHRTLSKG